MTPLGSFYFWQQCIEPPTLYRYEQPLIDGEFIIDYKGKKVMVRFWNPALNGGHGDWQVTAPGENYFRYNRDQYVVKVPARRIKFI